VLKGPTMRLRCETRWEVMRVVGRNQGGYFRWQPPGQSWLQNSRGCAEQEEDGLNGQTGH
jgi:hypothetical protein